MPKLVLRHEPGAYAFRSRWFGVASLVALLFSQVATASSAKTTTAPPITVNGSQVALSSVERDDSVFVPVRGFFEKLGANVSSKGSSIVAVRGGKTLARMTLGSRSASFNGSSQMLAVAPFKSSGSVMLPLRALSEATGATVAYEANPRGVKVTGAAYSATDATVAQAATPIATDAATATDTQSNQSGIPWWVWLLLAILVIGLIAYFISRRKKEPIITTRK